MAVARTLVETSGLALRDIACGAPRGGPGALRGGESTHVVLVRRGAFLSHLGQRQFVADPYTALISWADTDYRMSHPGPGGDDCLVVELSEGLEEEALDGLRRHREIELRLSPAMQTAAASFTARVRAPDQPRSALAAEERALEFVRALAANRPPPIAPPAPASGARHRLARAAVAALHRDLAANPSVSSLAAELSCSPFQLMRAMRAELGASLRGYRVAARLGAALHRLAEGEADLTRLALELGFASHAHLTATCVRLLGAPPSQLRAQLSPRARTFLKAHRAATS